MIAARKRVLSKYLGDDASTPKAQQYADPFAMMDLPQ